MTICVPPPRSVTRGAAHSRSPDARLPHHLDMTPFASSGTKVSDLRRML
jgi:hypothetical protein